MGRLQDYRAVAGTGQGSIGSGLWIGGCNPSMPTGPQCWHACIAKIGNTNAHEKMICISLKCDAHLSFVRDSTARGADRLDKAGSKQANPTSLHHTLHFKLVFCAERARVRSGLRTEQSSTCWQGSAQI